MQLRALEAERFFMRTMGIVGLARLLNRCAYLREDVTTFEEEQAGDYPLSPFDEHNLWSALIVLCDDLASLAQGLRHQALCQAESQAAMSPNTGAATSLATSI